MQVPRHSGSIVAVWLLAATEAAASTIHVPADKPTLHDALSVAVSGDTVLVSCGVYPESGLTLPVGVTLLGQASDSSCVVLDGGASGFSILKIPFGNGSAVVRWLTFRAARAGNGGAIDGSQSNVEITIAGCRFEHNYAIQSGGAVAMRTANISGCEFVDNTAIHDGGAVAGFGTLSVDSCAFHRNRASRNGGGLSMNYGDVGHCLFEAGWAASAGGGISVFGDGNVHDCLFRSDSSTIGGGAASSGAGPFTACAFENNYALQDGGGLWAAAAGIVTRCRFAFNWAEQIGGGYARGYDPGIPNTLQECSFFRNGALTGGGVVARVGLMTIDRCVIQGSVVGGAIGVTYTVPIVGCCDLYGNVPGDWTGPLAPLLNVNGNFSADALFCDPTALTVSSSSPLLAANNECGQLIGSEGQGCDTGGVVVSTRPAGIPIIVDGVTAASPTVYHWTAGSMHTIATVALHAPLTGVRSVFQSWSDGGALSHAVSAPSGPASFMATFAKSYYLTTQADGSGTVMPASNWIPARQVVSLEEIPDQDYAGTGWTGTGVGSYTGIVPNVPLAVVAPMTEVGHFQFAGDYPLTMIAQGGGSVSPPSGPYRVGTLVPIHAIRPPGYVLDGWSGQGPGAYTGPDTSATVTMDGPITETATFHYVGPVQLTMQAVGEGTVTPTSGLVPPQTRIDIRATPAPGYTFYRWVGQGNASFSGPDGYAWVVLYEPVTETAYFAHGGNFALSMTANEGGATSPPSGEFPAGSRVTIHETPHAGWRFREWQGSGLGSYSGSDSLATVTMHAPITEHALFEPDMLAHGFDFSISASASDPFVNAASPTGLPRSLYLWATCSLDGLAALEAGIVTTLPIGIFAPEDGVFNVGEGNDLLLAIGGCPTGENINRVLGSWVVLDTGGSVCLGASAAHGLIGAVDCTALPSFWPDPRVHGFSSGDDAPCLTGTNGCQGPVSITLGQFTAQPGLRNVEVSWQTSAETDHAGFHVYRSELGYGGWRCLTPEPLTGSSPYRYVDSDVQGNRQYSYELGALDVHGVEVRYGPVTVTTPAWAPLVTGFSGAGPNPFRGSVQLRFSLAAPSRVRLSIYDVTGRLVRMVANAEWPAGEHAVEWDGRSRNGRAAGGIYFVRFEAGGRTQTERVVSLGSGK